MSILYGFPPELKIAERAPYRDNYGISHNEELDGYTRMIEPWLPWNQPAIDWKETNMGTRWRLRDRSFPWQGWGDTRLSSDGLLLRVGCITCTYSKSALGKEEIQKKETEAFLAGLASGWETLCREYGLGVPDEFLSTASQFVFSHHKSVTMFVRKEPGFVVIALDGELPPHHTSGLLVGVSGMGWFSSPGHRPSNTDNTLIDCSPGELLDLVGLAPVEGRLPDRWTERDRQRSAMNLLGIGFER